MTAIPFDSLGYVKKLEAAGFTRQQAEAQADALREQTEAQAAVLQKALDKYDEASRKDLATKGDIQDVRAEIQGVRLELKQDLQDARLEIEKVRAEVEKVKYDLLKWQIGGWLALAAIMAKGFGWIGV